MALSSVHGGAQLEPAEGPERCPLQQELGERYATSICHVCMPIPLVVVVVVCLFVCLPPLLAYCVAISQLLLLILGSLIEQLASQPPAARYGNQAPRSPFLLSLILLLFLGRLLANTKLLLDRRRVFELTRAATSARSAKNNNICTAEQMFTNDKLNNNNNNNCKQSRWLANRVSTASLCYHNSTSGLSRFHF